MGRGLIRTLAGHSLTYAGATIVARASQMVTLLLLPMFLSPADYGAVQIIATIAILANIFVPLEIIQGLARYFPTAAEPDQQFYSTTAWWFTVVMVAAWLIMALVLQRPLTKLILGDLAYLHAFRFGLLLIALTLVFYVMQNQCRFCFDAKGYAWITIVFAVATMLGSIGLAMMMTPAINGVLLGQVFGAAVGAVAGAFRQRSLFMLSFSTTKLKQMLRFSLPLVPANLAICATIYSSRLVLTDLASLSEVGVFTFASQIAAIASLATLGVNAALTPLIMAHHEDPATPKTLARLFEGFTAIAIILCLVLGLLAPELVQLIGNPSYRAAGSLVIILAPAMLLSQMYIFAPGFAIEKRTTQQLFVALVSGAVGIAANYGLVPEMGVRGAAIASLLASSTFLLLWFVLSQRLYPIPVRWDRIGIGVAVGAALSIAGFAAPELTPIVSIAYKSALAALAAGVCIGISLIPNPVMLFRLAAEQIASRRSSRHHELGS